MQTIFAAQSTSPEEAISLLRSDVGDDSQAWRARLRWRARRPSGPGAKRAAGFAASDRSARKRRRRPGAHNAAQVAACHPHTGPARKHQIAIMLACSAFHRDDLCDDEFGMGVYHPPSQPALPTTSRVRNQSIVPFSSPVFLEIFSYDEKRNKQYKIKKEIY